MKLGPDLFRDTPLFRTHLLSSDAMLPGEGVLFSEDESLLAYASDGGRLQLWELPAAEEVPLADAGDVCRAAFSASHGGLLACAEGRLLLFRRESGFRAEVVASGLGTCNVWPLDLFARPSAVVLLAGRRVLRFDPADFSPLGGAELPDLSPGYIRPARVQLHDRRPTVRLAHLDRTGAPDLAVTLHTFGLDGRCLDSSRFVLPAGQEVRCDRALLAVAPLDGTSGRVLIDGPDVAARHGVLRWPHADPFAPHQKQGMIYPSRGAGAFATVVGGRVAFWKGLDLAACHEDDGTWYNVRLTDDGTRALFVYRMLGEGADLAGWFDVAAGRALGHCVGHHGALEHAFSPSGRYHVTVVTDDMGAWLPDGHRVGTLVLTDFQAAR